MHDVQSQPDARKIPINNVGVSGVRFPITVLDRSRVTQMTVATVSLSVDLSHEFKGTHMSRFIEALNAHRGEFTMRTLPGLLDDLRQRLDAERARVELRFPYFIERVAPATGARALMDYDCKFVGEARGAEDEFTLGVLVPVTSLCPCSKAISDYGAHNQRGTISIDVQSASASEGDLIWIEELVEVAEASASSPVYPLLKRPDERYVTMLAYDNPVFVEDMVRNVAVKLQSDPRVRWFRAFVENSESIHNHSAFAEVEWSLPTRTDPVVCDDAIGAISS